MVPLIKQREDVNSLYNFYKKWITYRNSSEVLTLGELSLPQLDQREVVALIRSRGTEGCLVLHNVSGTAVTVPVSSLEGFGKIDFATDLTTTLSEKEIKLPAYSSVVLKME